MPSFPHDPTLSPLSSAATLTEQPETSTSETNGFVPAHSATTHSPVAHSMAAQSAVAQSVVSEAPQEASFITELDADSAPETESFAAMSPSDNAASDNAALAAASTRFPLLGASQNESEVARARSLRLSPAILSSVPALLLLGLGLAARHQNLGLSWVGGTTFTPNDTALEMPLSAQNAVVAESQTLVVRRRAADGAVMWHALLRESRGVTGRAPMNGQITRVWVQEGQHVEVGDRILRVASSSSVLPESDAPRTFNHRAEDAQVEASKAQSSLQLKMNQAQAQLAEAQARIVRAKTRIAQATEIVRQLQAGVASDPENEYSNTANNSTNNAATGNDASASDNNVSGDNASSNDTSGDNENAQHAATQARAAALADAQNAARKAERAQSQAVAARRAADDAETSARAASQKAQKLRTTRERDLSAAASDAANAPDDEPLARSDDSTKNDVKPKATPRPVRKISVSQTAVNEADARAQDLSKTATQERERARRLANEAASAQANAQAAQERSARLLRQLQVFGDDGSAGKPAARLEKKPTRAQRSLPSISDAARMVRAATDESADAQREAHRLKNQVESYAQQAKITGEKLVSSSSELGSAEQSSLDHTLQANLSVMRAPASGTVTWVAAVADNVQQGDEILRMGGKGALQARFADYSGLWRNLKTNSTFPARVSNSMHRPAAFPSSTRSAALSDAAKSEDSVAAMARIESVTPPERAGEPALVRAVVFASPDNARSAQATHAAQNRAPRLRSGMTVWCALDLKTQSNAIKVPRSALLSPINPPAAATLSVSPQIATNAAPVSTTNPNASAPSASAPNASTDTKVAAVTSDAQTPHGTTSPFANDAASSASATQNTTQNATSSTGNVAKAFALVAILTPMNGAGSLDTHRIEWRRVELGATQGEMQQILGGLSPGERVALRPSALWIYAQNFGANATVHLRHTP